MLSILIKEKKNINNKTQKESWVVAHTFNPSYLEAKSTKMVIKGQSKQIVQETPSAKITRAN
jgi:hypothetical protein